METMLAGAWRHVEPGLAAGSDTMEDDRQSRLESGDKAVAIYRHL
jgi:hypothetical protein